MLLGQITCPSGHLVVADGGYLGAWSGERSPAEIDPVLLNVDDPQLIGEITGAVDFEIVGPDAEEAARAYDRQAGVSLYDIPMSHVPDLPRSFAEFCREQGFVARAETLAERVPHRERVRRSVARGDGGFVIFGIPVVVVGGGKSGTAGQQRTDRVRVVADNRGVQVHGLTLGRARRCCRSTCTDWPTPDR
ncbi:hypothetical protein ACFQ1S_05205 [Kibdelosporangium lantanae]|uniref:Uncharacterized protein n=1 Tax=Kibdelosporangium lantanae TaxID=1497396 RepID=A0ABW3M606_9PSEU